MYIRLTCSNFLNIRNRNRSSNCLIKNTIFIFIDTVSITSSSFAVNTTEMIVSITGNGPQDQMIVPIIASVIGGSIICVIIIIALVILLLLATKQRKGKLIHLSQYCYYCCFIRPSVSLTLFIFWLLV